MTCRHGLPLTLRPVVVVQGFNDTEKVIVPNDAASFDDVVKMAEHFVRDYDGHVHAEVAFGAIIATKRELRNYRPNLGTRLEDGRWLAVYLVGDQPFCSECGDAPHELICPRCNKALGFYVHTAQPPMPR